jgi:hypothetical protein
MTTTEAKSLQDVRAGLIIIPSMLLIVAPIIIFNKFLTGFFLLYAFHFSAFLAAIGGIFYIMEKIQKDKEHADGILTFCFIAFSLMAICPKIIMENHFYKIEKENPQHVSILKLNEAKQTNNISIAENAHSYTYKIKENDRILLVLMNKLIPNKSITQLIKQKFISTKEFENVKNNFLLKYENINDDEIKELVSLLKKNNI